MPSERTTEQRAAQAGLAGTPNVAPVTTPVELVEVEPPSVMAEPLNFALSTLVLPKPLPVTVTVEPLVPLLADRAITGAGSTVQVVPVVDDSHDWKTKLPKGRLDIVTRDGRTLSLVGDNVPGDVECPMSWDYLEEKFQDAAALAAVAPSAEAIRKAQQMVRQLEALDDASEVLRVLA